MNPAFRKRAASVSAESPRQFTFSSDNGVQGPTCIKIKNNSEEAGSSHQRPPNRKNQENSKYISVDGQESPQQIVTIQREGTNFRFRSTQVSFRYDGQAESPSPVADSMKRRYANRIVEPFRAPWREKVSPISPPLGKSAHITSEAERSELRRSASLMRFLQEKSTLQQSPPPFSTNTRDLNRICGTCGQQAGKKRRANGFLHKLGNIFGRSESGRCSHGGGETGRSLPSSPITDGYDPLRSALFSNIENVIVSKEKELKMVRAKQNDLLRDCEISELHVQILKKKVKEQKDDYDSMRTEACEIVREHARQIDCLMVSLRRTTPAIEQEVKAERGIIGVESARSAEVSENNGSTQDRIGTALDNLGAETGRVQTVLAGNIARKETDDSVLSSLRCIGGDLSTIFEDMDPCVDVETIEGRATSL